MRFSDLIIKALFMIESDSAMKSQISVLIFPCQIKQNFSSHSFIEYICNQKNQTQKFTLFTRVFILPTYNQNLVQTVAIPHTHSLIIIYCTNLATFLLYFFPPTFHLNVTTKNTNYKNALGKLVFQHGQAHIYDEGFPFNEQNILVQ